MKENAILAVDQAAVNQAEWENDDNWSHPLLGIYFSKHDTRTWVPKRVPGFGWTLNLGRPAGGLWLIGLLALPWVLSSIRRRRR